MGPNTVVLEEQKIEGKRLGRHVEHDERSHAYAVTGPAPVFKTVTHARSGGPFDQGEIGSCTGNATAGAINTVPIHRPGIRLLIEPDALKIYELATTIDDITGSYPPTDTGSSGLSAAKAAQQLGLITSYTHAFSMVQALTALMSGPVITGVSWYEGFDNPDKHGLVSISGQIRGGHEFEVLGFQLGHTFDQSLVICENSWGKTWGLNGRFNFTVATWQKLLDQQGDVTILHK